MGFEAFAQAFLNLDSLVVAAPLLLQGALVSLLLILSIVPAALLLGILVAAAYDLGGPWRRRAIIAYIDFLRAFPPLVLLIFLYAGLPFAGIEPFLDHLTSDHVWTSGKGVYAEPGCLLPPLSFCRVGLLDGVGRLPGENARAAPHPRAPRRRCPNRRLRLRWSAPQWARGSASGLVSWLAPL